MPGSSRQPTAEESLRRLRDGNARFVQGAHAPAELVFDQGLGDLFVIRVAGNVVAPSGIGSVEFAVSRFGTPLVVVMGHTLCGAVAATVQALEQGETPDSRNLRSITDRIAPHVEGLVRLAQRQSTDRAVLLREAGRSNILASTAQLRHGSPLLEKMVASAELLVVAAEYELETGRVEFFDVDRR